MIYDKVEQLRFTLCDRIFVRPIFSKLYGNSLQDSLQDLCEYGTNIFVCIYRSLLFASCQTYFFASYTACFWAKFSSLVSFMSAFNIFYMTRMLEQCAVQTHSFLIVFKLDGNCRLTTLMECTAPVNAGNCLVCSLLHSN